MQHTSFYTTLPQSIQHYLPLYNTTSLYTILPPYTQYYLPLYNTTSLYTILSPSIQHYLPLYNTTSLYTTLPHSIQHYLPLYNNLQSSSDSFDRCSYCHTIEQIGEALEPSERIEPQARVLEKMREAEREIYRHYGGLKPSHVKPYRKQDGKQVRKQDGEAVQEIPELVRTKILLLFFLFFNFWRTSVFSVESLVPLFWTSGDIYPGFQSHGGPPCLHAMDSPDSPLVWHLLTYTWPAWQMSHFIHILAHKF